MNMDRSERLVKVEKIFQAEDIGDVPDVEELSNINIRIK